jgi:hypothetical protein
MKKSPFRNIMLWLTILTLLWSSQGQMHGYVWCVTADGPTHLESVLDSHCGRGASSPLAETDSCMAVSGEEDAACGPCVDLAATHDTLQHRTFSGFSLGAPFLLSTSLHPQWVPPVLVRQLNNNLILEPPPRVATTLLVHRTIVLLI